MILAIWDQEGAGMDCVLTTLLSTAAVFMYPCKVTVFENFVSGTTIGDMIFGTRYSQLVRENTAYNIGGCQEKTIAKIVSEKYSRRLKKDSILEIIENGLYYIPQLCEINKTVFDYDFNYNMYKYIENAEEISDFTMICTENSENLSSPVILDTAIAVIVIIPISHRKFVKFLDRYRSILSKCYFIVMLPYYIPEGEITENLSTLNIPKNRTVILPCSESLEIHIRSGRVMDYVRKNINCSKVSDEYLLISRLKKAVQLIFECNSGGVSYQVQQLISMLDKRDYEKNKYKRLWPSYEKMNSDDFL